MIIFCGIIMWILTFLLFFSSNAVFYFLGKIISVIIIGIALFVITPAIIKKTLNDENIPVLIGLLITNSIPVFIASSAILEQYFALDFNFHMADKVAIILTLIYFIVTLVVYFAKKNN